MTNRSHYPPVTETSARPPWPYRHPRLFPATLVSGGLLIGTGLVLSIRIEVTVPLLLPVAGAASVVLLLHEGIRRRQAATQGRQTAERGPSLGLRVHHALAGDDNDFVGRDERDAVLELLSERYATAHLDDDEYGRRHTVVLWAKRRGELRAPVEGLKW